MPGEVRDALRQCLGDYGLPLRVVFHHPGFQEPSEVDDLEGGRYDAGIPVDIGGLRLGEDWPEPGFLDPADRRLQPGWHRYGDAATGVALARLDEDCDVSLPLAGELLPVFPREPGFLLARFRELVVQEVDVVDVAGHFLLRSVVCWTLAGLRCLDFTVAAPVIQRWRREAM